MGWVIAVVIILLVVAFYLENRNKTYDTVRKQVDTRYVTVTKDESGEVLTRFDLTFKEGQSGEPYYIVVDVETTGRYKYRNPDRRHLSNWPRIVQISWSIFDREGGIIKDVTEYFVQPRPIP